MSDFGGFNFSDLPRFDLGLANTARQAAEISAVMDDIADYNRKKTRHFLKLPRQAERKRNYLSGSWKK